MNKIILSIDSEFRNTALYTNPSYFVYESENNIIDIKEIKLSSIELPNTFYTFSENRKNTSFNIITFDEKKVNIKILNGSYTSDLMLNYIQNIFDNLKKTNILTQEIKIYFNEINSIVTFTSDKDFKIDFENNSIYPSLGKHLGFNEIKYSGSNTYVGESILNVIGEQYLYLTINNWGTIQTNNTFKAFAKIILNQQKTYMVYDNTSNFISKSFCFRIPEKIKKLKISIIDKYGNIVEMNQNFSLTLEIYT